jgi:acyl-CoA reductase-like NAD-dependent aldehyde dehydrogenase
VNPATGARLAHVAACGVVDVDRAVAAARALPALNQYPALETTWISY